MKIEGLKLKRKKQILAISLAFFSIIATLILVTTKAKYKNIQTMDLVNGTINYTPADINLVAIQIENDIGEYEVSNAVPSEGYTLSDKSYCNVNGTKDTSIKLSYINGSVSVNDISKKTKCYLYFDKYSAIDTIIGDITGIEEKIEFTGIATSSDTGIYSAPDDYGTSYYFRGLEGSLNNWVRFAGFYWRIIRVNGNGTIRMIYAGAASGNPSDANRNGSTTQIRTYPYNHTFDDNAYVGYMMGIPLNGTFENNTSGNKTSSHSNSYAKAHINTYNSDAKSQIDSWYKTNIEDKGLSNYIDTDTGFCNDRGIDKIAYSSYTGDGYGTQSSGYAPWGRLYQNNWKTTQIPTLKCSNKSKDLFTHTSASIGNKKLTYLVGLISSDEVVFGGGFGNSSDSTYYLYANQQYWTMSPYFYGGSYAYVFWVASNGLLQGGSVHYSNGLRPVINLQADTKFTYNNETTKGSATDPYIVV